MADLKYVSDEILRKIIAEAQNELYHRQDEILNEKKVEAKRAIEELIAAARALGKYSLGEISVECWKCEDEFSLDILYDDVLENIVKILGG